MNKVTRSQRSEVWSSLRIQVKCQNQTLIKMLSKLQLKWQNAWNTFNWNDVTLQECPCLCSTVLRKPWWQISKTITPFPFQLFKICITIFDQMTCGSSARDEVSQLDFALIDLYWVCLLLVAAGDVSHQPACFCLNLCRFWAGDANGSVKEAYMPSDGLTNGGHTEASVLFWDKVKSYPQRLMIQNVRYISAIRTGGLCFSHVMKSLFSPL